MKTTKMEGGFVWRNKGRIESCYSAVRLDKYDKENAGFAYENAGAITRCVSRSLVRPWQKNRTVGGKQRFDGFCVTNSGHIDDSFFLVGSRDELEEYRDAGLGLPVDQAEPQYLKENYRWDFAVFEEKNASKMDFLKKNWHSAAPGGAAKAGPVKIGTKKELLEIIERINRGDADAVHGSYVLTRDIDFRDERIPPIGYDREHPFRGVFDGGGFCIRGFALDGENLPEIGFFGCLYGKVLNLRIDCVVEGKNAPLTAAFCAVNFGEIYCCEATCLVRGSEHVGMFVGENYGHIRWCCVSGDSRSRALLWPWLLFLLPVLALALCPLVYPIVEPPQYEPILADMQIEPNGGFEDILERSNDNMASFTVPGEIEVSLATLTATSEGDDYVIANPNRGANYDFVAVLYMKNSAGDNVEVYRSGLIPVGYHIESLTLTPPDGVTLSAGIYDAEIAFSFYHHVTGEKGMLDSSLPVTLRIE